MSLRREVLSYLGTGAIGAMVGYYAGAQELLGIQSSRPARTPTGDSDTPTSQPAATQTDTRTTDTPVDTPSDTPTEPPESADLFDDFEDGTLDDPDWRANGLGPGGLAPENEIGIADDGHDSQYSMYVDQGGSLSNFSATTVLEQPISPSQISFWIEPTSADQFTKNQARFISGDTVGIRFNNHIQNDGLYFRFGDGNDEADRERVRDGAIDPDIGRFVEIRMAQIDWAAGTIGEVYVDGQLITRDAPFENTISGFDRLSFAAIGGGGTIFRIDDIGWTI